jgi:ubiquinone/menaquinone biosynthesis C-methylase UbiE
MLPCSDKTSGDSNLVRPDRYRDYDNALKYDKNIRSSIPGRRFSHWLEMRAFIRSLARIQGVQILDSPCGTGRIHGVLSGKFPTIISLDSSISMLIVHRHNNGSMDVCCGDIFDLSFPDKCFDWTVAYRIFHHFQQNKDLVSLLNSISRVSRQGVVFTAWIDTPLNKRRRSRRCSLPLGAIKEVISAANLYFANINYVFWPFQPKCVITSKKLQD